MNTTTFHLVSPTTGEFEISVITKDTNANYFFTSREGKVCDGVDDPWTWGNIWSPIDALTVAVKRALRGLPRGEDSEFSLSRGGDEVRIEILVDSSGQDPLWEYIVRDRNGKAVGWDGALPDWGCAVSGAIDAAMAHWEAK